MKSFLTPYGLSNSGQEKLQFTPLWGGPKPVCSDGLRAGFIESHNFFVLGPILVKFHIRTRLIEGFPTIVRTWWCGEEKLHFTPFHALRRLKCDEAVFPPLGRVVEFRARYSLIPGRGFWGLAKFGDRVTYGLRAISVCTHTDTHTHTHTHGYTHTRRLIYTSRTSVILRTFKGFWKVY